MVKDGASTPQPWCDDLWFKVCGECIKCTEANERRLAKPGCMQERMPVMMLLQKPPEPDRLHHQTTMVHLLSLLQPFGCPSLFNFHKVVFG